MRRRFRTLRRRRAALALLPAAAALTMTTAIGVATGAESNSAQFDANKSKVRTGGKVKLRGKFPRDGGSGGSEPSQLSGDDGAQQSGEANRHVRIDFRPRGNKRWRKAKTTTTDRDGRYVEKVKVRRTGRFRAVHADGRRSGPQRVIVKAKLRSKVRKRHVNRGNKVPIKGQVMPRGSKRKIIVRIGGDRIRTRTKRNGRFRVKWKADRTGTYKAQVRARGDRLAKGNKDKAGRTTVYRRSYASWYGPGFYGNRTACGKTLTPSTKGVAHRTMPCGTKLKLRHKGRVAKVRVIDRGPYHSGREFDLTEATKRELGFGSTGVVYASK